MVAPGEQTDFVIEILNYVLAQNAQQQQALANLAMEGRVATMSLPISADFKYGSAIPEFPEPEWRPFKLIHKNGKKRLEVGIPASEQVPGDPLSVTTAYRIDRGDAFYARNRGSFEIIGPQNREETWSNLASDITNALEVHDGEKLVPIGPFCRTHIERLKADNGKYYTDRLQQLSVYAEDHHWVIEHRTLDDIPREMLKKRIVVTIDPARGCQVVHSSYVAGEDGRVTSFDFLYQVL